MERQHTIAGASEVNVTVRVRGMSHEQRYFDAQATTTRVTRDFIVILLGERVDLDAELHVTNLRKQIGGTYRVAWTSPYSEDGVYRAGLELLDPEGEIWEADSLSSGPENGDAPATVLLQCQRCSGKVSTEVPDAETAALREGFTIARHCDTCKATTSWVFCVKKNPAAERAQEPAKAPEEESASKPPSPTKENREKGRAPIKLGIKITRTKYGMATHDIGETLNVSRTGAYFTTNQAYEVGEIIEVILPYHPDGLQIPVKARVVRLDDRPGSYQKHVAIHLITGTTTLRRR